MSHYQLTQVYLQALFGSLLDRARGDDRGAVDRRADRADRRGRRRCRDRRHDHLAEDAGRRQQHPDAVTDDRGVAAAIVLFPMFAAVVFMFVNGAMWQLDRQVATAAADRASQAVALHGSSVGAARSVAVEQMAAAGIEDISVRSPEAPTSRRCPCRASRRDCLSGMTVTVSATSVTPDRRAGLHREARASRDWRADCAVTDAVPPTSPP